MRTIVIIQARMGSSRLPGKVLADINGLPMVAHVLERARSITGVDDVVVATSDATVDDPLAEHVNVRLGAPVYRGSEHDVLGRFHGAARAHSAEVVIRVTGDCPLLSPEVSARVLEGLLAAGAGVSYSSNLFPRTYPRGLDTEAFFFEALETAFAHATSPADREHVTPFIWSQPGRFARANVVDPNRDNSRLRWTVDTPADLEVVRGLLHGWAPGDALRSYEALLRILEAQPELGMLNAEVVQKAVER